MFTLLDLCVSSLRRGHANLLCIVPILTDDPRRESKQRLSKVCSRRLGSLVKGEALQLLDARLLPAHRRAANNAPATYPRTRCRNSGRALSVELATASWALSVGLAQAIPK